MFSPKSTEILVQTEIVSAPTPPAEVRYEMVTARTPDEIRPHLAAWEDLAKSALDPNPFYEPTYLLPAMEHLHDEEKPALLFLYVEDPAFRHGCRTLVGLFPIAISSNYHGAPVRTVRLWQYTYCPLCLPLIRKELAEETLAEFVRWTKTKPFGGRIFVFERTAADGPLANMLSELLIANGRSTFVFDFYPRAILRKNNASTFDEYIGQALSGKHRKDLRRIEKRLTDFGAVEYVDLKHESELPEWMNAFLDIENRSWKGREGTSFSNKAVDTNYFRESLTRAFHENRLMMLAVKLNGKFIAMKYNILSSSGSFAYKIAFDEKYSRFSVGVLLELENMRRLFSMPELRWMDSCAVANHPMINRLWTERRLIQSFIISDGTSLGDFWIAAFPLMRWARGIFRSVIHKLQKEAAQ